VVKTKHLKKAPIVEAIIDFRVKLPSDFISQKFASFKKKLSPKYTKMEKSRIMTSSIKIQDDKPIIEPLKDKGIGGYKFTSRDKKEVAQFRIDGFTFSRLHPYTRWEEVLDEAKRLWQLYSLKAQPQVINRISVHYINRIDIPLPVGDLEEYFTASPMLPKTLPQKLNEFFTRLIVREKDLHAGIIQTDIDSPKKNHAGFIIDIDVFKSSKSGISEKEIWQIFERLHELKNRIFFELITEKTVRLFK
jgi:uncharacterized protein (TIGR04255 family)